MLIAKLRSFLAAKGVADSLRRVAAVDPDTGLYNESGLSLRAGEFGSEAARFRRPAAVVALKSDCLGADAATTDRSWSRLVSLVKSGARSSDIVGRQGPSEVLVVAEAGTVGAGHLVGRIVRRFQDSNANGDQGALRIGYCGVDDLGAIGKIEALIGSARQALHAATAESPVKMVMVG